MMDISPILLFKTNVLWDIKEIINGMGYRIFRWWKEEINE